MYTTSQASNKLQEKRSFEHPGAATVTAHVAASAALSAASLAGAANAVGSRGFQGVGSRREVPMRTPWRLEDYLPFQLGDF